MNYVRILALLALLTSTSCDFNVIVPLSDNVAVDANGIAADSAGRESGSINLTIRPGYVLTLADTVIILGEPAQVTERNPTRLLYSRTWNSETIDAGDGPEIGFHGPTFGQDSLELDLEVLKASAGTITVSNGFLRIPIKCGCKNNSAYDRARLSWRIRLIDSALRPRLEIQQESVVPDTIIINAALLGGASLKGIEIELSRFRESTQQLQDKTIRWIIAEQRLIYRDL